MSIENRLKELSTALRTLGQNAGADIITEAVAEVQRAKTAAEGAWDAERESREKASTYELTISRLERDLAEYKKRDLGPEVRSLRETVQALDERCTEYRRTIEDLNVYRAEKEAAIARLEKDVESLSRQKNGIEQISSWKSDAMEVLKMGVEKKIDPDGALRLAGYLATGNTPPTGAVDSLTLRVGMAAVKKLKGEGKNE